MGLNCEFCSSEQEESVRRRSRANAKWGQELKNSPDPYYLANWTTDYGQCCRNEHMTELNEKFILIGADNCEPHNDSSLQKFPFTGFWSLWIREQAQTLHTIFCVWQKRGARMLPLPGKASQPPSVDYKTKDNGWFAHKFKFSAWLEFEKRQMQVHLFNGNSRRWKILPLLG